MNFSTYVALLAILSFLSSAAPAFPKGDDEDDGIDYYCGDGPKVKGIFSGTNSTLQNTTAGGKIPANLGPHPNLLFNATAKEAVKLLKTTDLWRKPSIQSRHTNFRAKGSFTAYAWNDGPCNATFTDTEMNRFMKKVEKYCKDDDGKQVVGYAYQHQKWAGSFKEYGVQSTEAFLAREDWSLPYQWTATKKC